MPARVIRGEINASRSLERVSMLADLTFRALILAVDDYGRTDARLHVLRALIFPTRPEVTDKKLSGWLDELEAEGCIRRYVVEGVEYLCLPQWEKHRSNAKRGANSRFPEPPADSRGFPRIPENPRPSVGVGVRGRVASDVLGADAPARSARQRQKVPPPADLEPQEHEALEGWCRGTLSRPDLVPRLRQLVAACLIYHRGEGNTKADWYATAQTWVRNEAEERFGRAKRLASVPLENAYTDEDAELLRAAQEKLRGAH